MLATKKGSILQYKGSSFIRQRLILSILSGKTLKITEIRALEEEPGLKDFEISLLKLLDKVTNGTIVELNETGTSLFFQPGLLIGGSIEHECSLQRGLGYYLETLLMFGIYCKEPLNAKLKGVTSNDIDPSIDLVKTSMLQTLRKFLLDDEGLELKISKRGMLPHGGGEVILKCPVRKGTRPINLSDGGMVKRVRGTAYALRVSPAIANRMVETAKGVMLNFIPDVFITTDQLRGKQSGKSPGFGIHLYAETTNDVVYSAEQVSKYLVNDEEPSVPEDLGKAAAQRLLNEIYFGGVVDSTCQSLAILYMSLGPKDVSKLVIGPLTDYTIWFLRHLKEFLGVTFKIEPYENEESDGTGSEKVLLTCVGIGYTNISKRTI